MRSFIGVLLLLGLAVPAQAGLTERDLAEVRLAPPAAARIPLSLAFQNLDGQANTLGAVLGGHPGLLIPVDYTCRSVCGPTLSIVAAAVSESGLRADRDYRLIVVGIDPKDGRDEARALTEAQIGDPTLAASTAVLTGDASSIEALTAALGYRAVYDPDNDQFAHPSAVLALTPDGRVARVLSGLAFNPQDLRLALVEAGEGGVGGLQDRLALLCYGFDPVHGVYTPAIRRLLEVAATATVGLLALALITLHRRSRAARAPEGAS
jgi:protein SCO1/2